MSVVAEISSVDVLDLDPVDAVIAIPAAGRPESLAAYYLNNLAIAELQNLLGTSYIRPISNANHHVIAAIKNCGSRIALEDGSHWDVSWNDRDNVYDFDLCDEIEIVPNNLFSPYKYRLVNVDTGDSIAVNLSVGPLAYGPNTHWITDFGSDIFGSRYVVLENGRAYKISCFDGYNTDRWEVGHTVIMGCNNGGLLYGDAILINVELDQYVHTATS